MTNLSTRLRYELVGTLAAAAMDRLIDANLDRWITEAVADTTPLDRMKPIEARISELLRAPARSVRAGGSESLQRIGVG